MLHVSLVHIDDPEDLEVAVVVVVVVAVVELVKREGGL